MNVCTVIWRNMSVTPQRPSEPQPKSEAQREKAAVWRRPASLSPKTTWCSDPKQGLRQKHKPQWIFIQDHGLKKRTVLLHHRAQIEYPKADETNNKCLLLFHVRQFQGFIRSFKCIKRNVGRLVNIQRGGGGRGGHWNLTSHFLRN